MKPKVKYYKFDDTYYKSISNHPFNTGWFVWYELRFGVNTPGTWYPRHRPPYPLKQVTEAEVMLELL